MTPPSVSVVVPLYNSRHWIGLSLPSILAQTHRDFEVVVVDDGSTDEGGAAALAFGDPRVRVVRQANRGLAGARNTGIRESRGRHVALLDADDLWEPTKLEACLAMLEADAGLGCVFSWSALIDEAGAPLGMVQRPRPGALDAAHIFQRNPIGNGSAPVLRRAALEAIRFAHPERGDDCWFDESFRQTEDVECWTRLAATTGWRFACVDEALTLYRVNSTGLSANTSAQLATWRRFRAKVKGYAPALEAAFGDRAEAYQLRYLARRAIHGGDARVGRGLIAQALRRDPMILLEEPKRTLATLGAAAALSVMPASLFQKLVERLVGRAARPATARS